MSDASYLHLPGNLPVPEDDGACRHLPGRPLPGIGLPSTGGGSVVVGSGPGISVVYAYPMTGRPGVPLPPGWDEIPGARGCTPESCGFRDAHPEFAALGVQVYGLSSQSSEYQREVRDRLGLPFELLSDAGFVFTDAMGLPTFEAAGVRLIRRLTLVMEAGRVMHCFYPIFPPDRHAAEVIGFVRDRFRR